LLDAASNKAADGVTNQVAYTGWPKN